MKRRQLKKIIKGAHGNKPKLGRIYRQARRHGSKKQQRRARAMRRLSRYIDRESVKKLERCKTLIAEIDGYVPKNDEERAGIANVRDQLVAARKRHEEHFQRKREMEDMKRQVAECHRAVREFAEATSA